jgi:hypothetical protein
MADESLTLPEFHQETTQTWPLFRRIGFRFCFVYFILYSLLNQIVNSIFLIPKVDVPDWATLWPIRLPMRATGAGMPASRMLVRRRTSSFWMAQ